MVHSQMRGGGLALGSRTGFSAARRRRLNRFLVVLAAVGVLSTACMSRSGGGAGTSTPPDDGPLTVEVATGSLTSVVVTDGTVVASPEFAVVSPVAGVVSFAPGVFTPPPTTAEGVVVATVAGQTVSMPASGTIHEPLVGDGVRVAARVPLVNVTYSGFGVTTNVPAEDQYRLYDGPASAKVNIVGGPGGVDCQLVPLPGGAPPGDAGNGLATGSGAGGSSRSTSALCLLPLDTPVVAGLAARVGLTTGSRTDVLVIPVAAVSGRVGQGEVTKVAADGTRSRVTVGLGMTDGSNIEVTSGLSAGDTIMAVAPGLG